MQNIWSFTEKALEMASLLGNTKIIFEPHPDVKVNELVNYFTTVNA